MNRSTPLLLSRPLAPWRRHVIARAVELSCGVAGLACAGLPLQALAQSARAPLTANTLPVLKGVVGGVAVVNAPAPGAASPRMTIDQASQRAVLDWRSFNIGRDAEVVFNHQLGNIASTLNRIYDADPSVIEGRLRSVGPTVNGKATPGGQVILINQNGILFNRGAQVDTQALLASTLNLTMSNSQFCGGDLLACKSGAALTVGGLSTPAFAGGYDMDGNPLPTRLGGQRSGNIGIGSFGPAGAAAPRIESGSGGSVVLLASRIDNDAGKISSPDGQVVLAAGAKAYLAISDNSADITLRGFVVEVDAHQDGQGLNLTNLVRNAGDISADRGNVTLAALAINQEGRVSAKTAVQRNGSVYLTARTKDNIQAGTLHLAAGSVTEVMPDVADTATLAESTAYAPYRGVIRAQGGLIEHQGTLQAAGGRIGLEAADLANPTAARIYLGSGSLTSAAGFWSDVDPTKNLATFKVTSNELKNSPDQKGGILLGATVTVDLGANNNLLSLDAYRAAVPRTVAEKAAVGGEMSLGSTGSIIQRSGATLDVSGGGYRLAESRVATSTLLGDDGRLYDIGSAPQQRQYVAQLDRTQFKDERWGVTSSVMNLAMASGSLREASLEGQAGGTLRLGSGAGLVLDGALKGGVTIGSRQFARAPAAATLFVGTGLQPLSLALVDQPPAGATYNPENQRIGNVVWRQAAADTLGAGFTAGSALSTAQRDHVAVASDQVFGAATAGSQGRVESAFGAVEVNSDGRISLPADVRLQAEAGASLTLRAPAIDVAGDVRLPAGTLTLVPLAENGVDFIDPSLPNLTERLLVRSTAALSVAGQWINLSGPGGQALGQALPTARTTAAGSLQSTTQGGALTLRASNEFTQLRLERGALLDVGGGALLDAAGRLTGGTGGRLTLGTGNANQTSSDWMQAELRGFALTTGASLTLNVNQAQLRGAGVNGTLPSASTPVGAELLQDRGFASITVNAANGLSVDAGAQLQVLQKTLVVDPQAAKSLPSGGELSTVAQEVLLPAHQRSAASLTLAGGAGALRVGTNAHLQTDPGGSLTLSATTGLDVDGRLVAPAGRVSLTLRGSDVLAPPALHLGPNAVVSAAAAAVLTPNDAGLLRGNVLAAGTVTLDAGQTGITADAGSRLDVSGVEQRIQSASGDPKSSVREQLVAGHSGTLVLRAQGAVQLNGSLAARGPGTAAGGSFALEVLRPDGQETLPPPARLVVSSTGQDQAPVLASTATTTVVNSTALAAAGFEKLRLQSEDSIELQGNTTLNFERGVRLDAPALTLGPAAVVSISGGPVALGQSLGTRSLQTNAVGRQVWLRDDTRPQANRAALGGSGLLTVDADSVDIYGSSWLQGVSAARFNAQGDVRFIAREVNFNAGTATDSNLIYAYGSLNTAGNLEFHAAQLYPATRSRFDVSTSGPDSYLLVQNNGQAANTVYSAGGSLKLEAPTLVQAGRVMAPLGSIELKASRQLEVAAGSLTSVSGEGTAVLYGSTLDGVQWRYVDGAQTNSLNAPRLLDAVTRDGKQITMISPSVTVAAGARVDLRGGGDVVAVEFVPGNGGDADLANAANTFAIIPSARLSSVPYDTHLQLAGGRDVGSGFVLNNPRDANLYDSITLGAGSRVPAGEYVLLPTRFAVLPGAFLVQLQTASAFRNLLPDQTGSLANGEVVVAAQRGAYGTAVRDSQTVGAVVLPGSAISRYSDYTLTGAALFAERAERAGTALPTSPWDAGRLNLLDANSLTLAGQFLSAAASEAGRQGRVAEVDITGPRIAIVELVGLVPQAAGTLELSSATLSSLNASVLVGGRRTLNDGVVDIRTTAEQVTVATSPAAPVNLPELLISARQSITVASGSVLRASASVEQPAGSAAADEAGPKLRAEASGALIRLSAQAQQATLDRGTFSSVAGDLDIAAGAVLQAQGSALLDATRSHRSRGLLQAGGEQGQGGSLSLSAARITAGQTPSGGETAAAGLVLSNTALLSFAQLDDLTLRAYERVDLVGNAVLGAAGLKQLTLDTPLLVGSSADGPVQGPVQSLVQASQVNWLNRSSVQPLAVGGGARLLMDTQRLVLGEGGKATQGFSEVVLKAGQAVELQGQGSLRVGAVTAIETPVLRVLGGAEQTLAAVDTSGSNPIFSNLRLGAASAAATSAASAADLASFAAGGRLTLQGQAVEIETKLQANAGRITVQAVGADLVLGETAQIDAQGISRNFSGSVVAADGGTVELLASSGTIAQRAGARVDVSGAAEGGGAGQLVVRARQASLQGNLQGQAAAGERSGSVSMDLDSLANFSAWNAQLNAGGFNEQRELRQRSGDLSVAAGDTVDARRVTLSTDTGSIQVLGTVGRNTEQGGAQLSLHAQSGLTLGAGSRLLAAGTGAAARGGEVRVDTRSGSLVFDRQAQIDVRAGSAGAQGSVIFGVTRSANQTPGASALAGQVLRYSAGALAARQQGVAHADVPATVDLEATRIYSGAEVGETLDANRIAAWATDHQAFVGTLGGSSLATGMRDDAGALLGARVLGATEVRASSALTLASNWDLSNNIWRSANLPGTLTLRATGDVTLNQTLGAPKVANVAATTTNAIRNSDINNSNNDILAGDSWNIRVVAGADMAASNPLAVRTDNLQPAHLVLANSAASIRTGTGRIDLAAAGDIRLDDAAAVIYTAGRIGAPDTATYTPGFINDPATPRLSFNRWAVDGGSIGIRAGGSLLGPAAAADLWVTEWLRRPRQTAGEFTRDGFLTDWWSLRSRFQQGIGTLGGGNIDVHVGADVRDLMFALPTSGRTVVGGGARSVEVAGGGDLVMRAGADVDGASFLLGRGEGRVAAAGNVGRQTAVQAYLMGVSSGPVPERATLTMAAGNHAHLQSVDNPTYMGLNAGTGERGPSFHPNNPNSAPNSAATTFFTYSANSALGVMAMSGDLTVAGRLTPGQSNWRSFGTFLGASLPQNNSTAFPASLSLQALNGNIDGPSIPRGGVDVAYDLIKTYPSAQSSVVVLAGRNINGLGIEVSDLAPSALVTPTQNESQARLSTNTGVDFFNSGSKVTSVGKPATQGRIVERVQGPAFGLAGTEPSGPSFDVQALEGSISFEADGKSNLIYLPARSRIRAGQDIISPNLQLQNLNETDTSEVRAVAGRIDRTKGSGGIEIGGPGRLLVQAAGDVDLGTATVAVGSETVGGLVATANTRNTLLRSSQGARITVLAGVSADVDLSRLDSTLGRIQEINGQSADIASLLSQLAIEVESAGGPEAVLAAANISALAGRNPAFVRFQALDKLAPEALTTYQQVLLNGSLPLKGDEAVAASKLLGLLAKDDRVSSMAATATLTEFLRRAEGTPAGGASLGGQVLSAAEKASLVALSERYPALYSGAVLRRVNGATLTGTGPLIFDQMLTLTVGALIPSVSKGGGNIYSFNTAIQNLGSGDIDLWAPAGDIVVGLTTPRQDRPVGVLTSQGGAVRSVLSGNFSINQGKVLTAQGGDILIFSAQGSIDAGRGAKTSLSTPAPQRRPILDAQGNQIGVQVVIPASATGSGIQTLTSDPDGLGPLATPAAGDVYLFAPAGKIDAGEAGIRSSGNILINAQVVLNASDIKAAGASQGVPQVASGSLASTLAAGGSAPAGSAQAEDKAAKAAEQAAKQASAASRAPKPTVLSVEVLGFGDKNCKEDDKDCFAK
jgi:filamentous hemagglutinin family protein